MGSVDTLDSALYLDLQLPSEGNQMRTQARLYKGFSRCQRILLLAFMLS